MKLKLFVEKLKKHEGNIIYSVQIINTKKIFLLCYKWQQFQMLLYQKTWICIHRKNTGQTALPPFQKVGEGGRFSSLCHRFFFL